jgi:pseudaminic acid cytidylyltransferase
VPTSVAIIPARGGSKRIPRKNIREFCGKPLMAWPIEVVLKSSLFERVIVSTDDPEVSEIANQYGAETPFLRPAELADDYVGTSPVVAHAINKLVELGAKFDRACCVYPTAPLLRAEDLQLGAQKLDAGWDFAFSATGFGYPVQRGLVRSANGGVEMLNPEFRETRSQDLPEVFHDAGQFYFGKVSSWLSGQDLFAPRSTMIRLPRWRVQDIDTLEDFHRAEFVFKLIQNDV